MGADMFERGEQAMEDLLHHERARASIARPVVVAIFGASGDLTQRKLVPALHTMACEGLMPEQFTVLGLARSELSNRDFREQLLSGVEAYSRVTPDHCQRWKEFADRFDYVPIEYDNPASYDRLAQRLREFESQTGSGNCLFYLATPPQIYTTIVKCLGAAGLSECDNGWRRIVVEKPFGHDLPSAQALNHAIHEVFDEEQVYRIDHYLGKETVQNLLVFRFANTIFEPVWNRNYVDKVEITVAESVGVGRRGGYYERAGVMRDMIQNHVLQLLTLTAMEPPVAFNATALRNEKVKVLQALRPIRPEDVAEMTVRGQYRSADGVEPTYRREEGVDPQSETATYAALKFYVDNWRWQSVPFYVRSGKALKQKSSEIVIAFKRPPHLLLPYLSEQSLPNRLSICIQPDEGIHLTFKMKVPGAGMETREVVMEFHYGNDFGDGSLPDAYERLLVDALQGDASLFARSDEIEASWAVVDPILEGWAAGQVPLSFYQPGTWGPDEGDELLARDGRAWLFGCASP